MDRIYEKQLADHLSGERQMAVLTGPRQVGKTTSARASAGRHHYLTRDRQSDRRLLTQGPDALAAATDLSALAAGRQHLVLDEVPRYRRWRDLLKGLFDVYGNRAGIIVAGSARLGFFRRGGDSLMGRYFPYRMHPLSVAELVRPVPASEPASPPVRPPADTIAQLLQFGGFPEPLVKASARFSNRWRHMRRELLFREDLRDLSRIQEDAQARCWRSRWAT